MLLPKIEPGLAPGPAPRDLDARRLLEADLRTWWEEERADWDDQVSGGDAAAADLWESMPVVDSKTVARMAPIFEKHEGRPFDVRRIRPGGYAGIEDVIEHLVHETTPGSSGPAKHVPRKVDS